MIKNIIVIILITFIIVIPKASAQNSDFYTQTTLTTTYSETGEAVSKLQVSLRNLVSQSYPDSLKIFIHGERIKLLSIKDDYGELNYIYTYLPSGINEVDLKFTRYLVGKNVVSHIYMVYQNPDALRSENTWVVFFPRITIGSPGDFQYQMNVPKSFGRLIASETEPQVLKETNVDTTYGLNGENLLRPSRLIFGDSYPFAFTLNYRKTSALVLPADLATQKIYLTNISPQPTNLILKDGNWVALYKNPEEKITVSGYVVFFKADSQIQIPEIKDFTKPEDMQIKPHPYQYIPVSTPTVTVKAPKIVWPFINNQIDISVKNPNSQALYNVGIQMSSEAFEINSPTNPLVAVIPPMGSVTIPLNIKAQLTTPFAPPEIKITMSNVQFGYNLQTSSLVIFYIFYCVFAASLFLGFVYAVVRPWRIYFQRRST